MMTDRLTPSQLWARQQITEQDVNYQVWSKKRESIRQYSRISHSCIFTVDVFKQRYDFASDNFSLLFGYNPSWIQNIRKQGDMLEERIHPDDRVQLMEYQVEHGLFIYSLPPECRNDYQQIFQLRMLKSSQQYINIVTRQQVVETDRNGKAWIIMGIMDISPDQGFSGKVKRTVIHRKTGEIIDCSSPAKENELTIREKEILLLIRQGLLSKEIAYRLSISIHTVNNHRKNILAKLNVNNFMEVINKIF